MNTKIIEIANIAVISSGKIIKKMMGKAKIDYKGEIDLVTEADKLSQQNIIDIISQNFPDHTILAEEGENRNTSSDYRWIIDPLDGTTNYAHGFPFFCVSIGVEYKGKLIVGVVYDPNRNELFSAELGKGAYLNGEPIHVSDTTSLDKSLLATGFPYDIRTNPNNNLNYFVKFSQRTHGVRRPGAAALDLCYLAAGRLDGFWELKLNPWDVAAGTLIIIEAGGMVTDMNNKEFKLDSYEILASNGKIHSQMYKVIQEVKASSN